MVLEGRQSRWFLAKTGGFPLSPLLYTIYLMDMMKQLEEKGLAVTMDGTLCVGV